MKKYYPIILFIAFFTLFGLNSLFLYNFNSYISRYNFQKKLLAEIDLLNVKNKQYTASAPLILDSIETDLKTGDGRVVNLKRYLRLYDSPLYDYADEIVRVSDKYSLDYRILVAIAGIESTFGRRIPPGSHNAWGWGIYGDTVTRFDSWEQGIETVAEGIKRKYVDRGLVTPQSVMKVYTPSSNGSWAKNVNYFFSGIETSR